MTTLDFIGRASVITGLVLGSISIVMMLWRWTPWRIRSELDRQGRMLERLANIVELQAVVTAEPPGSQEHADALTELRRLRRVSVTGEKE